MVTLTSALGLVVLAPLALALPAETRASDGDGWPVCAGLGPPADAADAQACINWLRDQEGSRAFEPGRWGSSVCVSGRAEITIVSRVHDDWATSISGATIAAAAQTALDKCKDPNGGVKGGAIADGDRLPLGVSIHLPVSMQPGWGK